MWEKVKIKVVACLILKIINLVYGRSKGQHLGVRCGVCEMLLGESSIFLFKPETFVTFQKARTRPQRITAITLQSHP